MQSDVMTGYLIFVPMYVGVISSSCCHLASYWLQKTKYRSTVTSLSQSVLSLQTSYFHLATSLVWRLQVRVTDLTLSAIAWGAWGHTYVDIFCCHSSYCLPCHLCLKYCDKLIKTIFGLILLPRSVSQAKSVEDKMLLFTTVESTQVGHN